MNKAQLIKLLQKTYPEMTIMADGNGWVENSPDLFVISAEDDVMTTNGYDMLNYWTQNYTDYVFGVHTELGNLLEENGWYAQWVNPGVLSVVKDN